MLRDIANSKNPLAGLVEIALREKGADLTAQTVARYEDLMASAIRMDAGEQINGGAWSTLLAGFPDGSKLSGGGESFHAQSIGRKARGRKYRLEVVIYRPVIGL